MRTHSIVFAVIASTTAGCASQFADRLLHRPPPITDEGVAGTLHAAQIVFASAPIAANADASTPLVDHVRADQPACRRGGAGCRDGPDRVPDGRWWSQARRNGPKLEKRDVPCNIDLK